MRDGNKEQPTIPFNPFAGDGAKETVERIGRYEKGPLFAEEQELLEFGDILPNTEEAKRLVAMLEGREKEVLELFFGLDGTGEKSSAEIGKLWGITEQEVKKIKTKALTKLREIVGEEMKKEKEEK